LRVDGPLDAAHEVESRGILVAFELDDLGLADAVLGAEAAAMLRDEVVDRGADLGSPGGERAAVASRRPARLKCRFPSPRWP
jgi:hypothetical protein